MNHVFNFQGNEIVGVMAFLGTCFALLVAAVTMMYVLSLGKFNSAEYSALDRRWVGLYVATLFGFSLTGRDLILGLHGGRLP